MAVRTSLAIAILGVLAGLAVFTAGAGRISFARDPAAHWAVAASAVLLASGLGLALGRWWGRWLGLAVAVMCTALAPWVLFAHLSDWRPGPGLAYAFLVGPLLLMLLSGRSMFERFDATVWSDDGRTRLVRWAVITNVAGIGGLLFQNLFFIRALGNPHHAPALGLSLTALFALIVGVMLLGWGKTAGLLILAGGTVAVIVSVGRLLPHNHGIGALALATTVTPGICVAMAAAAVYAKPIWRFLRS